MENDPRQQVDAGDIGGEQRHHVRGQEYPQREYVQIIGDDPQAAEEAAPDEEATARQTLVSEAAYAQGKYF